MVPAVVNTEAIHQVSQPEPEAEPDMGIGHADNAAAETAVVVVTAAAAVDAAAANGGGEGFWVTPVWRASEAGMEERPGVKFRMEVVIMGHRPLGVGMAMGGMDMDMLMLIMPPGGPPGGPGGETPALQLLT